MTFKYRFRFVVVVVVFSLHSNPNLENFNIYMECKSEHKNLKELKQNTLETLIVTRLV